jgi:hypothetical protein
MLLGQPNQHQRGSTPRAACVGSRPRVPNKRGLPDREREEAGEEWRWPELAAGGNSGEAKGTTRFTSTPPHQVNPKS